MKENTLNNIRAVVFDAGGTLMEYRSMPHCWSDFYTAAFQGAKKRLSLPISDNDIYEAAEILKSFNPRINYREEEIPPEKIFCEAVKNWRCDFSLSELINIFFSEFNLEAYIYPETVQILKKLKEKGFIITVFTDVASAMPDEMHKGFFKELLPYFDMYVSSQSCGYRKPDPKGLTDIQNRFGLSEKEMIFIGDEKKDIDTAKRFGCLSVLVSRDRKYSDYGQDFSVSDLLDFYNLLK